jgi:hypothetical protein
MISTPDGRSAWYKSRQPTRPMKPRSPPKQADSLLSASAQRLAVVASGTRIKMFNWSVATAEVLGTEQQAQVLSTSPRFFSFCTA